VPGSGWQGCRSGKEGSVVSFQKSPQSAEPEEKGPVQVQVLKRREHETPAPPTQGRRNVRRGREGWNSGGEKKTFGFFELAKRAGQDEGEEKRRDLSFSAKKRKKSRRCSGGKGEQPATTKGERMRLRAPSGSWKRGDAAPLKENKKRAHRSRKRPLLPPRKNPLLVGTEFRKKAKNRAEETVTQERRVNGPPPCSKGK